MSIREGAFYPIFPILDGTPMNRQWGLSRSNTSELKAIARNTWQELEADTDSLNATRALVGLGFGDLDFRNRFRFFYDSDTDEFLCQSNTGTVDDPTWADAWQIRFHDNQFQVVSTGGIFSSAGFYTNDDSLESIGELAESGTDADTSFINPTKLFFRTDDGFSLEEITTGANSGHPELRITSPYGIAQSFEKRGKEWKVEHNFDTTPILAQVMDRNYQVVIPDKADLSDPNTAYFYFNEVFSGYAYLASGGVGAASLLPRDPFYLVVRTDEMEAGEHLIKNNADLVFDATYFYVNVDLDSSHGGAHKSAFVSLTDTVTDDSNYAFRDGSRSFTGHVDFDDTVYVENAVTAEAFYTKANGEVSPLTIEESDGSPSVDNVKKIVVSGQGTVTDDGSGQVTISVTGVGIDHGTLAGLTDVADHPGYALTDGTRAFSGSIIVNGAILCTGGQLLQNSSDDPYNLIIDSGDTTAQNALIYFRDRGDTKWTLYKNTSNHLVLYDTDGDSTVLDFSSSTKNSNLLVASNGNLGIGVATPTRKLHVGGKGYFSDTVEAEAFYVTNKGEVPSSYIKEFSAAVEWEVNHNLDRSHFIVQAFNGRGAMIIPDSIYTADRNTTWFYFGNSQAGKAVVLGVG